MNKETIAIIGGGSSGLMTAITTSQFLKQNKIRDVEVIILERLDRVGKKLLATGNGRCNITNINASKKYYHGKNLDIVDKVLKIFTPNDTIKFFEKIGLLLNIESDGKVYPYTNQASSVLDILRMEANFLEVKELCNFEVKDIQKLNNKFIIKDKSNKIQEASKVVIATGGNATPNLGSNGSGYKLFKSHTLVNIFPALVQLKSDTPCVKALNGIKINAIVSVIKDNKIKRKEEGEVLFTEYGLSGIVILQLSRLIGEYNNSIKVSLDIMPDFSKNEIIDLLQKRASEQSFKTLDNFLVGMFNKRVGQMLLKTSNIMPLSRLANSLLCNEIITLANNIKQWTFNITGTMGFNNAQVTAGGISTEEFNPYTLESKLISGLYATGEVLDIDGDCGGFNLQWSWSTGYIVGKSLGNLY